MCCVVCDGCVLGRAYVLLSWFFAGLIGRINIKNAVSSMRLCMRPTQPPRTKTIVQHSLCSFFVLIVVIVAVRPFVAALGFGTIPMHISQCCT